jgi:hypothetical protein
LKFLKEHILFIGILGLSVVLRFLPLFDYQFTYDELSGLERTQFDSFSEVIEKGVKIDAHPALVQLIIYYLTKLFGYVTWIIKLPFLFFSLGLIIYAYAFGLRNFSKQTGLIAALIFSFSLIFVFYAPIARMYISGAFFSMALLYYFFEIFFLKELKWSNFFFLGLFAWLSALNQHINGLFALTMCVSGMFFLTKENFKLYLLTCVLVVVAYLPHLQVTLYQLGVGGIGREQGGWLDKPDAGSMFRFLKIVLGTGKGYLVFAVLIFAGFIERRTIRLSTKQLLLAILFASNFGVVYFYSVYRASIFQNSVMLFSSVAVIIFICSLIEFKNKTFFYVTFGSIFILLIYRTYYTKDYFHQAVKTVYEYQFERTLHYKKLYGDNEVYPVFFDADEIMKKIYFSKYGTTFNCKISADSMISNSSKIYFKYSEDSVVSSLRLFSEFVKGLRSNYVVLTSSLPIHQAIVSEHFPYLIENTQTQAINFKLYSKKAEDRVKVVGDDQVINLSTPSNKEGYTYSRVEPGVRLPSPFVIQVDSIYDFPFEAKAEYFRVTSKEGEIVLAKATVKIKKAGRFKFQLCIAVKDREKDTLYNYNSKEASDFIMKNDSTLVLYSDHYNGTNYNKIRYSSDISCYFWNLGKEKFEINDFEIKTIDYCPKKWHYWD